MKRALPWKEKLPIERVVEEASASGLIVRGRRYRFHPVLFVAFTLLFIFLLGLVFQASGLNMWHLFVTWDNETMEMREAKNGWKMKQEYESDIEPAFNDAFFQKLKEFEMYPLLPSWMPEGFELTRVEGKIETEYYQWALGTYTYGDKQFYIAVTKDISENSGGVWSLEKDERKPDIYEQDGIKFYIMDNLSRAHAFWFDLPYIISITGHVTRDELKQMINSMFERK